MAGQIIKRSDNTYTVRVFQGRDGGKRVYLNYTVHGTKKDAERKLTALLHDKDMGALVEPTRMSVNEYLDHWLTTMAPPTLRESTYRQYVAYLKRYVRPKLGSRRVAGLDPLALQELYAGMQARGLSPRTVRYTHEIVRTALLQAVKWRMLPQSPTAGVRLPQHRRVEIRALTPDEAHAFVTAAEADKHGTLFALALATGMRPGEYLGLRWGDVDLKAGTVRVVRALDTKPGPSWPRFTEPKTPHSRRMIPLPRTVTQSLQEHRDRQRFAREAAGPGWQDYDLVFTDERGAPLLIRTLVKNHFKRILKRAELPDTVRLYDLRHSCATLLLGAGENIKVVSERLGHASVRITLDRYAHVLPDMQARAAERLEGLLFGSRGEHRHTIGTQTAGG